MGAARVFRDVLGAAGKSETLLLPGLVCVESPAEPDDFTAGKYNAKPSGALALLDFTAAERTPASRLACQLRLDAGLDGLLLHLPATQF